MRNVLKREGLGGLAAAIKRKAGKYLPLLSKSTTVPSFGSIMIEVTNRCNLRCTMCPREHSYGRKMRQGMIDIGNFRKLIDEVSPFVRSACLTGLGEPLLYKDFGQALEYVRSKIPLVRIFISTNFVTPEAPRLLAEFSDKLDAIQISIDGIGDVYDRIRGRGNYALLIDNLRKVHGKAKDKAMFNMVVSAENYRQMADVVGLARELGIQQVSFNAINFVSMPDMGNADYRLFSSDEFVAEFGKAAARARELGIRMASFDFAGPPGFKKCRFPWNDFYVTWDGYLVPCCAKPFPLELNFGNVFEKGIMACVNSVEFSEFRKAWHRNEAPGFCDRCHMIGIHNDRKSLLRIRR